MPRISARQRLAWGSALIGLSVVLLIASFAWRQIGSNSVESGSDSTAIVEQYRNNYVASTTPTWSVPTQTNISVTFPREMTVDETRRVSVKVERFTVGLSFDADPEDPSKLAKWFDPVKSLEQDVEVNLISSGFDVQGVSTAKEGSPFPLAFAWTISPKKEGKHELLLDLSELVRDARNESELIGTTEVRVHGDRIDLKEGTVLPFDIHVSGQFGLPGWMVSAGASLPGFIGFVLTYPIFLEWFNQRRKRVHDAGSKGAPLKQRPPGESD